MMVLAHSLMAALCLISVNARYAYIEGHPRYVIEEANILEDNYEDAFYQRSAEPVQPSHIRMVRQVGSMSTNADGTMNLNAKVPIAGNDRNVLSGVVAGTGLKDNGAYGSASAGLALDNVNGHGLALTGSHIPQFGNQLTAAGRVNLLNTPDHNLNANAFASRSMPSIPNVPDFNTYGGSVDYMFKNKVGGSFGVAQTPLFQKTDYSAMANMNLFKDRTSSLDLNAGLTKSVSPFISDRSWQPSAGLKFTKWF